MIRFVDTHCHLDGEEFDQDRAEVMARARDAGCAAIFLPAIDLPSSQRILALCQQYPDYLYPMVGLHPEEVRADWREVLEKLFSLLTPHSTLHTPHSTLLPPHSTLHTPPSSLHTPHSTKVIAIGEIGLDFYWSREFEKEQLEAFELQVQWSIETRLPLMIHCRKAQNEMVHILKRYERELPGGVFHCFTGNEKEAAELLRFDRFVLGIGGVSTFKKSPLPQMLSANVPLDRLVLETDAPYMAPVPIRGKRNESAFITYVIARLAEAYQVSEEQLAEATTANVNRIFGLKF